MTDLRFRTTSLFHGQSAVFPEGRLGKAQVLLHLKQGKFQAELALHLDGEVAKDEEAAI